MEVFRQRSLEQLEGEYWPDQEEYISGLIRRCHEYRKIPVGKLTSYELCTLIGQDIGVKHLLIFAIEILETDLIDDGGMYEGRTLECILKVKPQYWQELPNLVPRLKKAFTTQKERLEQEYSEKEIREITNQYNQIITPKK